MMDFNLAQLRFCLHRKSHGHETVEAAGVVSAVIVLSAAVHVLGEDTRFHDASRLFISAT